MENVVFIYTTKCKSYFQFYFKNSIFHSLLEWLFVFKNATRFEFYFSILFYICKLKT